MCEHSSWEIVGDAFRCRDCGEVLTLEQMKKHLSGLLHKDDSEQKACPVDSHQFMTPVNDGYGICLDCGIKFEEYEVQVKQRIHELEEAVEIAYVNNHCMGTADMKTCPVCQNKLMTSGSHKCCHKCEGNFLSDVRAARYKKTSRLTTPITETPGKPPECLHKITKGDLTHTGYEYWILLDGYPEEAKQDGTRLMCGRSLWGVVRDGKVFMLVRGVLNKLKEHYILWSPETGILEACPIQNKTRKDGR